MPDDTRDRLAAQIAGFKMQLDAQDQALLRQKKETGIIVRESVFGSQLRDLPKRDDSPPAKANQRMVLVIKDVVDDEGGDPNGVFPLFQVRLGFSGATLQWSYLGKNGYWYLVAYVSALPPPNQYQISLGYILGGVPQPSTLFQSINCAPEQTAGSLYPSHPGTGLFSVQWP